MMNSSEHDQPQSAPDAAADDAMSADGIAMDDASGGQRWWWPIGAVAIVCVSFIAVLCLLNPQTLEPKDQNAPPEAEVAAVEPAGDVAGSEADAVPVEVPDVIDPSDASPAAGDAIQDPRAHSDDSGEDVEPPDGAVVEELPEHPLIFEMERAGYDVHAELAAAVADGAFEDAVRVIVETDPGDGGGLLPDVADEQLLVGYPEFVTRCAELFPPIAAGVREQDDLGQLRLNAALAEGDLARAESVACQFPGTDAAARAYRWLGDVRLSEGKFRLAEGQYRTALRSAAASDREELLLRLRLAAGMQGREAGVPAAMRLDYRGMSMDAEELEAFVQTRINEFRARGDSPGGDPTPEVFPAVAPSGFQVRILAEMPVSFPGSILRDDPESEIDWSARAASLAVMQNRLLVSSRSEVEAIDLDSGRQAWQQGFDGFRTYPAQWSWTSHRLLCRDQRVFVRYLPRGAPRLACLDAARGRVLWESNPQFCIASDPIYVDGRIVVLDIDVDDPFRRQAAPTNPYSAMRRYSSSTRPLQLSLLSLDADTGEVVARYPLARFHKWWEVMFPCRVAPDADGMIASVGGVTLRTGWDGRLGWVRRHDYQLPEVPVAWFAAHHSPPLVIEDRVIVSQPGVTGIQCLDTATGERFWDRAVSDLRRVLGIAGSQLVVQRADALEALSLADGSTVWRHEGVGPTEAVMCGDTGIVYADCREHDSGDGQIVLRWLAPRTGRVVFETPLAGILSDRRITHMPYLGPMVPVGEELILACDRGQRRSQPRMLYRLTPVREPR